MVSKFLVFGSTLCLVGTLCGWLAGVTPLRWFAESARGSNVSQTSRDHNCSLEDPPTIARPPVVVTRPFKSPVACFLAKSDLTSEAEAPQAASKRSQLQGELRSRSCECMYNLREACQLVSPSVTASAWPESQTR